MLFLKFCFFINVCSKKPFSKYSYYIETSQLNFIANQLTGFYIIQIFTKRYFWTDVDILMYLRRFENDSIFTEVIQNHIWYSFPAFLFLASKRSNSRNITKSAVSPLNFFLFCCWKFVESSLKFSRLPQKILLAKKSWNQDAPNTLVFLFYPDSFHLVCHFLVMFSP